MSHASPNKLHTLLGSYTAGPQEAIEVCLRRLAQHVFLGRRKLDDAGSRQVPAASSARSKISDCKPHGA